MDHSLKAYLEEEHEGNPLIVGVIPSFIFTFDVCPYSRVGYVGSNRLALLMWQCECGCDPAVSVDHMSREGIVCDAVDRITCKQQQFSR